MVKSNPTLLTDYLHQYYSQDTGTLGIINCDFFDPNSEHLVNKLQSLYRECYENDQKIVFLLTKDYYQQQQPAGIMLQSIQRLVKHIDISNFFIHLITTNSEIQEEYSWVLSNISTDPVPFKIIKVTGEFTKVLDHNKELFFPSLAVRKSRDLDLLSDRQTDFLFKSKTFCMLPWVSMYVKTDSNVAVCCRSTQPIGDCSKQTLTEIWNDQPIRQLRLDMLNNKKIDSCQYCYYAEEVITDKKSNRRESLAEYAHLIDLVDKTHVDGSLSAPPIWLTTKINNLCNQSCRMCNPVSSSSWHKPAVYLDLLPKDSKPLLIAGKNKKEMVSQITEYLPTLQRITFEGGEPLMIEEFWNIIEKLDQLEKYDISLTYNTNLTKSRFKNKSIFDYWKKFNKVYVRASLDAQESRAEYLRPGARWHNVVKFRQEMMEKSPNVFFEINATLSILNALHIPDFHKSWVDQGLIEPRSLHIGFLTSPQYLNVRTAPAYLRNLIVEKYKKHLEWLIPLDPYGKSISSFQSAIEFISSPLDFNPKLFWQEIAKLDHYYGVDLLTTFPELKDLPVDQNEIRPAQSLTQTKIKYVSHNILE